MILVWVYHFCEFHSFPIILVMNLTEIWMVTEFW